MFVRAKQIWLKGRETEMNTCAVIRVPLKDAKDAVLHIGGTAFFRVYTDGDYVANGPARAGESCIREDAYALPKGTHEILIEAVGYYCKSLATVRQPSFLIAEVTDGDDVLFATDEETEIYAPAHRLQKTERYSVQRHFTEVCDERGPAATDQAYRAEAAVIGPPYTVLPRRAKYPSYTVRTIAEAAYAGVFTVDDTIKAKQYRYSWAEVPESWGIFSWDEIPYHPHYFIQKQRRTIESRHVPLPLTLMAGEFAILEYGEIEAGFLTASVDCRTESDLVIGFAEYSDEETFAFPNMNVHNALEYLLPAGGRELQTFEPYTAGVAIVLVKTGELTLRSFGVRTFEYDDAEFRKTEISDPELREIYDAAVRNFRHNSVDLFTDCPSRERAGWLGDALFTSRTEYFLTGGTATEDAHLENMRYYRNHGELPDGAWPETYPSDSPGVGDHGGVSMGPGGTFIPQSDFLLLLEISEHLEARGRMDEAPLFRPMVESMLGFFARYENEDGLLECLPSWNFIEWSKANEWTKDVSYPTNFLYAETLSRLGRIYDEPEWTAKAGEIRKKSIAASFDGRCFRDHAIRDGSGRLVVQPEKSEACQYYALLFGDIDRDAPEYRELRRMIREDFAFGRPYDGDVLPAEMIIGLYLRLELLMKWGERDLLRHDVKAIFGKMHQGTGTLWEYLSGKGSRDHAMASYLTILIAFIEANENG